MKGLEDLIYLGHCMLRNIVNCEYARSAGSLKTVTNLVLGSKALARHAALGICQHSNMDGISAGCSSQNRNSHDVQLYLLTMQQEFCKLAVFFHFEDVNHSFASVAAGHLAIFTLRVSRYVTYYVPRTICLGGYNCCALGPHRTNR